MDLQTLHEKDGVFYRLAGTLNFRDRDAFAPVIAEAGNGHGRTVRLDLHDLSRIDSFGIGMFLVAHETAQDAGNRLVVENVRGDVARVFHLANLDAVLCLNAPLSEPPRLTPCKPAAVRLTVNLIPRHASGTDEFVMAGRFTFADRELFEELMSAMLRCIGPRVVLDMANLEFLDSAGLSMILIAREECQKRNLSLLIQQPGPRVLQLFRLSALDDMVTC